jgi:hypothetical protein
VVSKINFKKVECFSNGFELLARAKKPVSGCYSLRSKMQPYDFSNQLNISENIAKW